MYIYIYIYMYIMCISIVSISMYIIILFVLQANTCCRGQHAEGEQREDDEDAW